MEKKRCVGNILLTGLILSGRLISMSSIVFSPYWNVIKIEHSEDYVYRTRVKWRVEVIVQIIQAKQNETKQNQPLWRKRRRSEPGRPSPALCIVQIHQRCIYIYFFCVHWA